MKEMKEMPFRVRKSGVSDLGGKVLRGKRREFTCFAGLVSGVLLLFSISAHASEQLPDDKRTVIRFDDDTISGDLVRPDGDLLWSRPRLDMPSLVVPPSAFNEALERTLAAAAQEAFRISSESAQKGSPGGR